MKLDTLLVDEDDVNVVAVVVSTIRILKPIETIPEPLRRTEYTSVANNNPSSRYNNSDDDDNDDDDDSVLDLFAETDLSYGRRIRNTNRHAPTDATAAVVETVATLLSSSNSQLCRHPSNVQDHHKIIVLLDEE